MQDRRLSIIQDTAVDDLHDIDTHAFDDKSPSPHHESSVKSYMESHSPNDENSHKCSPRSPLMGRDESVVDEGKVEMVLEVRREEGNGKIAFVSCMKCLEGIWLINSPSPTRQEGRLGYDTAGAGSKYIT